MKAKCYGISCVWADTGIKISKITDKLSEYGKILFVDNRIIAWVDKDMSRQEISKILDDIGLDDFYVENINVDRALQNNDFFAAWLRERISEDAIKEIEEKHQDDLAKMNQNIQKANELLRKEATYGR